MSALTITTPCSRPENLQKLYDSIDFKKINRWIICYDTSKDRTYPKKFNNEKILEITADGTAVNSQAGHFQHNEALNLIKNSYVYRIDDDTIIHPNFWNFNFILTENIESLIYTFDCVNKHGKIYRKGDIPKPSKIDTSCFCVHSNLIGEDRWQSNNYDADGQFIYQMVKKNKMKFTYVPEIMAYYNRLR